MKYLLVRHKVADSKAAGVLDEPDCWYLD